MDTHLEAGGQWLPDTLEIIEDAKAISPERFVGEVLPNELHEAMIVIWLNGCADDQAGSVDSIGHVFRVGRHVVETDGHGFTTLHSFGTESEAQELIDFVSNQEAALEEQESIETYARDLAICDGQLWHNLPESARERYLAAAAETSADTLS